MNVSIQCLSTFLSSTNEPESLKWSFTRIYLQQIIYLSCFEQNIVERDSGRTRFSPGQVKFIQKQVTTLGLKIGL